MSGKRKSYAKALFFSRRARLILVSAGLALLFFDMSIRALESLGRVESASKCKMLTGPLLGIPRPSCEEDVRSDSGTPRTIRYDAFGLLEKKANRASPGVPDLRILLLGDCHIVNLRVDEHETLETLLEEALKQRGVHAEVRSLGTGGISTVGAEILLRSLDPKAPKFDLVLYNLTESDIVMNYLDAANTTDATGFRGIGNRNPLSINYRWPVIGWVGKYSKLNAFTYYLSTLLANAYVRFFVSKEKLLETTVSELRGLEETARARGLKLFSYYDRQDLSDAKDVAGYWKETRWVLSNTSIFFLFNLSWVRGWEPELLDRLGKSRVHVIDVPIRGVALPVIAGRLSGAQNRVLAAELASRLAP